MLFEYIIAHFHLHVLDLRVFNVEGQKVYQHIHMSVYIDIINYTICTKRVLLKRYIRNYLRLLIVHYQS